MDAKDIIRDELGFNAPEFSRRRLLQIGVGGVTALAVAKPVKAQSGGPVEIDRLNAGSLDTSILQIEEILEGDIVGRSDPISNLDANIAVNETVSVGDYLVFETGGSGAFDHLKVREGGSWQPVTDVKYYEEGALVGSLPEDGIKIGQGGDWVPLPEATAPAIPDSVVNRWPFDEGSGTTAVDAVGSDDVSFNFENWVSDSDWIGEWAKSPDGVDDEGSSGASAPSGSLTMAISVEFSSTIDDIQYLHSYSVDDDPVADAGGRRLWFRGDRDDNLINFSCQNDGDSIFEAEHQLSTNSKYRIVGVLDTGADELSLWVNGTKVDSDTLSGSFNTVANEHRLFVEPGAQGDRRYYGGVADEPLTADEAWTASEIESDWSRMPFS